MNANASYEKRNATFNIGETRFEAYCTKNNIYFRRVGFDQVNGNIPNFFNLNALMRNLPDYFICNTAEKNQPTALIMVKGTPNITQKEYELIPQFVESYASPRCPLLYAFLYENMNPIYMKPENVIKLYKASTDRTWTHNKTIHRTLYMPHPDGGYWGKNPKECQHTEYSENQTSLDGSEIENK
jgi:hypothetical protein